MRRQGYAGYRGHKAHHDSLLRELDEMTRRGTFGKADNKVWDG